MIQYWPYEQSEDLNNEVASLFESTKKKLYNTLSNNTYEYLYLDILDNNNKYNLLYITLEELENTLLEIINFNLSKNELQKLNYQIFCNFIQKVKNKFFKHNKKIIKLLPVANIRHTKSIIPFDHEILLGNLMIYLIFGSSYINSNKFIFENYYTPKSHVSILLENFVIQAGNIIIKQIFFCLRSLSKLRLFLDECQLCSTNYMSIRSLAYLKNNLLYQEIIDKYIYQPNIIYNSSYKVLLISSNGIISKKIYISRISDIQKLTKKQLILLLIIEIQDILLPKIENIIINLSKIILYIFINFIINIIIFLIKIIIYNTNHKNEQ